jgi:hypothetical protein
VRIEGLHESDADRRRLVSHTRSLA